MSMSLSKFEVYLVGANTAYTDQFYSNGNQQCPIAVHIQKQVSTSSGFYEKAVLNATERASLTIVPYSADIDGSLDTGWSCGSVGRPFDQGLRGKSLAAGASAPKAGPVSGMASSSAAAANASFEVIIRYLTAAEGVPAVPLRFMARITLSDGTVYTTHFDNEDVVFESSVTLNPQRPYVLPMEDLVATIDSAYARNISGDPAGYDFIDWTPQMVHVRIHYWQLPAPLVIAGTSFSAETASDAKLVWAFGNAPGQRHLSRAAALRQGTTSLFVRDLLEQAQGADDVIPIKAVSRSFRALWCLVWLNDEPLPRGPFDQKLDWDVTDNFGCVHRFRLQQASNGDSLELVLR